MGDCLGTAIRDSIKCDIFRKAALPTEFTIDGISSHASFDNCDDMVDEITFRSKLSISPVIPPLNFNSVTSNMQEQPWLAAVSIDILKGTPLSGLRDTVSMS